MFPTADLPFYTPTNSAQGFRFLYVLANTCHLFIFVTSHPNEYVHFTFEKRMFTSESLDYKDWLQ